MATQKKWILICDASRGRLFAHQRGSDQYELVGEFEHPESRARARDLVSDGSGRRGGGQPGHGGAGVAASSEPSEVEARKHARDLAETLNKGRNEHAYAALVIAAPPHFLGLLKGVMDPKVAEQIELTLDKDLTMFDAREIARRIAAARAAS